MLSPALSLLGVFVAAPMALTIWLSFQDWSTGTGFGEARFVGLDNFRAIFGPTSVGRDFIGGFCQHEPLHAGLGRADPAAVGRARTSRLPAAGQGRREFKDHPVLDLYGADDRGRARLVEALFARRRPDQPDAGWVGLPPGRWLSSPDTALGSIVILNVWQQVGYFTVLAVAGLTQIPASLHEAAELDGAGPLQRFVFVTLPLLRRTLLFSAVIAVINAVQVFEPVALITQGGPVGSTNVLTYHIRRVGIERSQGGLGSAMAVMLMLALIVTVVALFALARRVEDDGP